MTAAHLQRLEQLLTAASEIPPDQRATWFTAECPDASMRGEVEALLARLETIEESPANPIVEKLQQATSDVVQDLHRNPLIGENCGGWKLRKFLGQGGMGAVYLGVREGDDYQQKAAIKLLRFGQISGAYAQEQFRRERRILAALEHPHITRLIDGGTYVTSSGTSLPFLAMEFVDGQSLLTYSEDNHLSLNARIVLFQKVCQAVQFAHQNLIVHRDLKPGNILVTATGEPKLLDFGIARLFDPAHTAPLDTVTRIYTPHYASPEQMRGEPALPASDIYSLGAILYELLSGERPAPSAPSLPSTLKGELAPKLSGDLDNIILMALRPDPLRRYKSASQFSDDLDRYLHHRPVAARPDSFGYRVTRYVQRNRVTLLAVASVIAALALGFAAERKQARLAGQRFQQVRNLSHRFIFEFNDQVRLLPGSTHVREMMVTTALEYLDNLSLAGSSDPGLRWELAKAYEKVADVQGSPVEPSLGHAAEALKSYRKSADMQEALAKEGALNAAQRESLAHTYSQIAAVYRAVSAPADAMAAAERGVFHARAVSPAAEGLALQYLASAQLAAGEPARAIETARTVIGPLVKNAASPPGWSVEARVASMHYLMGRANVRMGRFEEALQDFTRTIAIRERHTEAVNPDIINPRELVLAYQALADTLGARDRFSLGRTAEAIPWYRKALARAEQMSAADEKNASARMEVVRSTGKLGAALETSAPAESIRLYQRVLTASETLLPEGPARTALRSAAYRSLARPLARSGKVEDAWNKLRIPTALDTAALAAHATSVSTLTDLSEDWLIAGEIALTRDPPAAIPAFQKSLEFSARAAALSPKDFAIVFSQVEALEALRAHGDAQTSQEMSTRLNALWAKWASLQPESQFIQSRLAGTSGPRMAKP